MKENKVVPVIPVILYLALLCLHVIPSLTKTPVLWGVDQWYYLPWGPAILLFCLGLIPVIPAFRNAFVNVISRMISIQPFRGLGARPVVVAVILVIVSAFLFWSFRQVHYFLGDGHLWASRISTAKLLNYKEPLASLLYQELYRLLTILGIAPDHYRFASILGILSGLVFIVFAYKTARITGKRTSEQVFVLLAILSTGTMMLFFGYVEVYPPVAAWTILYIFVGIRYLRGRANISTFVLICVLGVLLHLSLLVLIPALLVAIRYRKRELPGRRWHALVFGVPIAAVLIFLAIAQRLEALSGFFSDAFLPLATGVESDRIAYHLFSPKHFFDIANELLLICPIALLLFAVLKRPSEAAGGGMAGSEADGSEIPGSEPDGGELNGSESLDTEPNGTILLFLKTITVFYIFELFIFNTILGASRDWDLFSPLAIPLALLTALFLLDRFRAASRSLAVIAFSILVIHTLPWIAVNSSAERSLERFTNITNHGFWSNFARAYAYSLLGIHYEVTGDIERSIEYASTASTYDPNPRYTFQAASLLMDSDRNDEAILLFEGLCRRHPDDIEARKRLGMLYLKIGQPEKAKIQFRKILETDSTSVTAYNYLGMILFDQKRFEEMIEVYTRSIELDPDNYIPYKNIGISHYEMGNHAEAIAYLQEAIERRYNSSALYRIIAKVYQDWGDLETAASNLEIGVSYAPDDPNLRFEYALILEELGRYEQAVEHLSHILERYSDPRIMNSIGVIRTKQGKTRDAISMFESAVSHDPQQVVFRINLANAYYETGMLGRAWVEVRTVQKMGGDVPADLLQKLEEARAQPIDNK
ncbi:MAG: tetratricopeptide repeat protein [bacterium]|nr:MAG: tetratricopeptide repeat protein [bacterium]